MVLFYIFFLWISAPSSIKHFITYSVPHLQALSNRVSPFIFALFTFAVRLNFLLLLHYFFLQASKNRILPFSFILFIFAPCSTKHFTTTSLPLLQASNNVVFHSKLNILLEIHFHLNRHKITGIRPIYLLYFFCFLLN